MLTIRPAQTADLPAITAIYNEAVLNTVATFDLEPQTLEKRTAWFQQHHGAKHPVLVAEDEFGTVVGWSSLSEWSERIAYAGTAEVSFYVTESQRGRGVGRQLFAAVLEAGKQAGLHTVISCITEGNDASVHLHKQYGFTDVGVLREVGFKFGRLLDVQILQKIY